MTCRVAHLTSVHPWTDPRIFHKMCVSLAQSGYDVHLVAARGPAPAAERIQGVTLHLLARPGNRLQRMTRTAWQVYRKAVDLDAKICHFHDPELIPVGVLLRLRGCSVIYDVHEDMPKRVLDRQWIPGFLRRPAGWMIALAQKAAGAVFAAVVTATPTIAARFDPARTVAVRNFPSLAEFPEPANDWSKKKPTIAFIGTIDSSRGVLELINGFAQSNAKSHARLVVAGKRQGGEYDARLDAAAKDLNVEFSGYLERTGVQRLLDDSMIGAITNLPSETANEAISTKMFEYMAAGLPVLTTDMPLWTEVVEKYRCGVAVDPFDPAAIARSLDHFFDHAERAIVAGRNGRAAIEQHFNWAREFAVLLDIYDKLSAKTARLDANGSHDR